MLKIRGNDIELDGNKIARLFDINGFLRGELQEMFDKANNYKEDVRSSYELGRDGK